MVYYRGTRIRGRDSGGRKGAVDSDFVVDPMEVLGMSEKRSANGLQGSVQSQRAKDRVMPCIGFLGAAVEEIKAELR